MKRYIKFLYPVVVFIAGFLIISNSGLASVNYNNVVNDAAFDNTASMSIAQIDSFLNSFSGSCISTNSGFGAPDPTGYNPSQGFLYGGTVSAGRVIYDAAIAYNMNPQVLISTTQKEEGLVDGGGAYGCSALAISAAVGYGCPDSGILHDYNSLNLYTRNGVTVTSVSGICVNSAQKVGFSQQIIHAAWLFSFARHRSEGQINWAIVKPGWDNSDDLQSCYSGPMTQGTYVICPSGAASFYDGYGTIDGTSVHMDNGATAALYYYTPHMHGQLLFYNAYAGWFGSPNGIPLTSDSVRLITPIIITPDTPVAGEAPSVSFTVQNFDASPVTIQTSILQCRFNTTTNCDSSYDSSITLQPDDQKTFTYTLSPLHIGSYMVTPYFETNNIWYRYGNPTNVIANNFVSIAAPAIELTSPLVVSPANPVAGESSTVAFTAKNFGAASIILQTSVLQCRFNVSTNCDSGYTSPLTIQPGEQRAFSYSLGTLNAGVTYKLLPYFEQGDVWYRFGSEFNNNNNSITYDVPNIRLVGSISASPGQPIPGQPVTVSYTVQNMGSLPANFQNSVVQCRFNTGTNCDSSYNGQLTINAGAQHTFNISLSAVKAGTYTFVPYFLQNSAWYRYGTGTPGGNTLTINVPAYVADMHLVSTISALPGQPIPGQPVTVSYTVQNMGSLPAIYQNSILQCRFNMSSNCDPTYDGPLTINAGAQRTFTVNFPSVKAGTYVFAPYYMQNDTWYRYIGDAGNGNAFTLNVPAYVADMHLIGLISASPSQPASGQTVTISYTVQNMGSQPAIFQNSILQCRFNTTTNCDSSYDGPLTINSGAQRTFTVNLVTAQRGTYVFTPYFLQNDIWYRYSASSPGANALIVNVP